MRTGRCIFPPLKTERGPKLQKHQFVTFSLTPSCLSPSQPALFCLHPTRTQLMEETSEIGPSGDPSCIESSGEPRKGELKVPQVRVAFITTPGHRTAPGLGDLQCSRLPPQQLVKLRHFALPQPPEDEPPSSPPQNPERCRDLLHFEEIAQKKPRPCGAQRAPASLAALLSLSVMRPRSFSLSSLT